MTYRDELLQAARRHLRPGVTNEQAVILGVADLEGAPLDPHAYDDAATLFRAERLVIDDLPANEALHTARLEHVTWNHGQLR